MPDITRLIQSLRAAVAGSVLPGAVAMAGNADGVVIEAAEGFALDSVVWLASLTKPITSVAAMQLVERGQLSLDAPLGPLLPVLAAPHVLEGFDDRGQPVLRPARGAITLRHLLTHTAGFGYEFWSADLCRFLTARGLAASTETRMQMPLLSDPGARWRYGINTDFVGLCVEAASGMKLDAYLAANITGPLGMVDTGFRPNAAQRPRVAPRFLRAPDGALQNLAFSLDDTPAFFSGGGALYGSMPDYLRFTRMLLRGGELDGVRILAPETVAAMGRNQIGDLGATPLRTALPQLSNDVDFFPGQNLKFGLGFLLNPQAGPNGRRPGSMAWAGLANTYFWIDPAAGLCGVFATQVLPFADHAALAAFAALERAAYQID